MSKEVHAPIKYISEYDVVYMLLEFVFLSQFYFLKNADLTNSMAYGTRWFNVAFTNAHQ